MQLWAKRLLQFIAYFISSEMIPLAHEICGGDRYDTDGYTVMLVLWGKKQWCHSAALLFPKHMKYVTKWKDLQRMHRQNTRGFV